MFAYTYKRTTKEYVSAVEVQTGIDGQPLIPAFSSETAPPAYSTGEIPVFGTGWTIEEDHRGETVYSTTDKSSMVIENIGPIPSGYTALVPGALDTWSGTAWVETLATAQSTKIQSLNDSYTTAVTGTFQSSALGTSHTYKAGVKSRTDILGAMLVAQQTASTVDFECVDDSTGLDVFVAHTASQLQQVLSDGAAKAVSDKQNLLTKTADVNAATTVSDVDAITW